MPLSFALDLSAAHCIYPDTMFSIHTYVPYYVGTYIPSFVACGLHQKKKRNKNFLTVATACYEFGCAQLLLMQSSFAEWIT